MQLFNFNQNEIRVIEKNGEPWFVLKDACDILDLGQVAGVKRRLSDDVISNHPIPDALGRMQDNAIVNEDGLYDVILESRKPEAKAFRKWITSDVVPAIRKDGLYMTPAAIEKTLNDPDFIIGLANRLKNETARANANQMLLDAQRSKVVFAESLETSKDSMLIGELAKLLKQNGIDIGATRLFEQLRQEGYLHKSGSQYNLPTQRSMDLGILEIKIGSRASATEGTKTTRTSKVTGKGQIYFINKYKAMFFRKEA